MFTAGQMAPWDGSNACAGHRGEDVFLEAGREATKQRALNILVHLKNECDGDFDRVWRCVRVDGVVASTPAFAEQSLVVNGVSDLRVAVIGDASCHAHTTVGVSSLPRGAAVAVEAD